MRCGGVGEMRVLEKSGKIPDFILTKKNRANASGASPTASNADDAGFLVAQAPGRFIQLVRFSARFALPV